MNMPRTLSISCQHNDVLTIRHSINCVNLRWSVCNKAEDVRFRDPSVLLHIQIIW
jgi:hypothetical protein